MIQVAREDHPPSPLLLLKFCRNCSQHSHCKINNRQLTDYGVIIWLVLTGSTRTLQNCLSVAVNPSAVTALIMVMSGGKERDAANGLHVYNCFKNKSVNKGRWENWQEEMAYCMLIFFSLYSLSLFFFFLKFNWVTSSQEDRGQKTECGEEFYIRNNYSDVFFTTRIKFRQMDLIEGLLRIWWLFWITFTLLRSFEFIGKGEDKWDGMKSLDPHVFKGPMTLWHLCYPSRGNRRCCVFVFIEMQCPQQVKRLSFPSPQPIKIHVGVSWIKMLCLLHHFC